ncbi:hypothetical protein [Micromonospora sp. LOL_024]|uniref:hypothetical protein n=1 Tax=Micromonospora sp. LOL_024 TaxID=3345412 RepID=UPI003A849518
MAYIRQGPRRAERRGGAVTERPPASDERRTSNAAPDAPLPERVVAGKEPFIILGAMAAG